MRLRHDSWWLAGKHRAMLQGTYTDGDDPEWRAEIEAVPAAEPGDVWHLEAWGVGYVLACPAPNCTEGVHFWFHAFDCPANSSRTGECKRGAGRLSCWDWTGSPEAGDLSASPSLHSVAERGGCGWHGWLRSGQMVL